LQSRKAVSIIKEHQVTVLIFTGRDFSLGVTERAKRELCFYFRRRLEPTPSGVEGNDDRHVIWALCERCGIAKTFDVVDCGGIDGLYEAIPVRFKQSGIQAIGIIIDADTEINNRWVAVKNILSKLGFAPPDNLPATGLILSKETGVKAGVWLMPDNKLNGMLEDFRLYNVLCG
jgi:hypothetical protein